MFPDLEFKMSLREKLITCGLIAIVVAIFIGSAIGLRKASERDLAHYRAAHAAAIDLYMRECKDGVAACAVAYDMSPTLRQIYLDKANK